MSVIDTRWVRLRRRLAPLTRHVPYGHLAAASVTYARRAVPMLPRPERRFVIFAQGRSGSTLLTDILNSHPRIYCADEILTWPHRYPLAWANACSIGHRGDTYGFKVKIYQLTQAQRMDDPGVFLRRLHDDGWQLIHLQRHNILRQALSAMVAAQRDMYHLAAGAQGPQAVKIDVDDLLWRTEERARFLAAEDSAMGGIPHLKLSYESDLLQPEAQQHTGARVFEWLGLEPAAITVRLRKIVPEDLNKVVVNYDEAERAIRASPFAELLDQA